MKARVAIKEMMELVSQLHAAHLEEVSLMLLRGNWRLSAEQAMLLWRIGGNEMAFDQIKSDCNNSINPTYHLGRLMAYGYLERTKIGYYAATISGVDVRKLIDSLLDNIDRLNGSGIYLGQEEISVINGALERAIRLTRGAGAHDKRGS